VRSVTGTKPLQVQIIDELGYVPLSPTGAELLFETFSQRYERGSTIVTSNLPFEDWTSVLGSQQLTGALLDRLTHHVSILTMNGDSYRHKESAGRRRASAMDPETGEITQGRSPLQGRLCKKAPYRVPFCKQPCRAGNGRLLRRRTGLKSNRR